MTITQQRVTDNEVESSNKHENLHRKVSFTLHNHHHETDNEGSKPHNHRHEKMLIENEGVETSSMMMPSSGDTPLLRKTSSLRNLTSTSSLSLGEDSCACDILGGSLHDDLKRVSSVGCTKMHRSQSCGVRSEAYRHCGTGVRFHIGYRDENLKERCRRNTHELLQTAAKQATVESTSTILARKALRYRRIMERMQGADVNNPAFDLTEHLGVRWERVIPQSVSMDQEDEKEEEEKEEG